MNGRRHSEERGIPLAPYRDAERGGTALLVIDMIGRMEFTGSGQMRSALSRAADAIARLRDDAEEKEQEPDEKPAEPA